MLGITDGKSDEREIGLISYPNVEDWVITWRSKPKLRPFRGEIRNNNNICLQIVTNKLYKIVFNLNLKICMNINILYIFVMSWHYLVTVQRCINIYFRVTDQICHYQSFAVGSWSPRHASALSWSEEHVPLIVAVCSNCGLQQNSRPTDLNSSTTSINYSLEKKDFEIRVFLIFTMTQLWHCM